MIVQAARIQGAIVVAAVSSATQTRIARKAGADHVIRRTAVDFAEAGLAIAGLAAIHDSVGPTVRASAAFWSAWASPAGRSRPSTWMS
jgi:NADPH:quinone reductase-like Zn-dependent oxidoreductase